MASTFLDRKSGPHILTLVAATAVGTLSINVFLPSMPGMARYFQADYAVVQLTVSLYLAATALLQLFIGPASDRFGRRPVMLTCLGIFLVGTLAAIFAPTIEVLLLCRLLQAFSAAGMVLGRAVVRDTVETDEAASKLAYMTMGTALVPMIAPMMGGLLEEHFGWRSTFALSLAFGMVAITIVYLDLGETNHRRSSSLAAQFRTYPVLLRSAHFWGYVFTAACTSGAFFAFVGGGPYVSTEMLGLAPARYGLYFGLISIGYILGNLVSGRFSFRVGINRMMLCGNLLAAAGTLAVILFFAAGFNLAPVLFVAPFFTGMGNGVALPNATAGIVSAHPPLAGSASGLGGALQIGGGAALSFLAAALLSPTTGPYPLLWVMFLSSSGGVLATAFVMRLRPPAGADR